MQKIEYINGFKIVHNVPDYTEDQKEEVRQDISNKIFELLYSKDKAIDTKVKNEYNCSKKISKG